MFIFFRSRAALILALLAIVLAPVALAKNDANKGNNGNKNGNKVKPPKPPKPSKTNKQEIKLMEKLCDFSQASIELALVGDAKTSDTAVKTFCEAYAAREQAELTQLEGWLQTWYQIAYAPKIHDATDDDGDGDSLISLVEPAFTKALLDELKGAHSRCIAQGKQADKKGYHAEFKALAKAAVQADKAGVTAIKTLALPYATVGD